MNTATTHPGRADRLAVAARLAKRIRVDQATGCWLWTGCINRQNGYGKVQAHGRVGWAHRVSYETFQGPIPDGLHIDHRCRNRACINPEHLEPVTPAENVRRSARARQTHLRCRNGHDRTVYGYMRRDPRVLGGAYRACRRCRAEQPHRTRAAQDN